ncbi:phosphoribosylanthranilate isomerase [Hominifimenecus sp. rT4P-3]|uniref:phosphoribosylanthranilate isomerase n=1 Tax=Hominifimenecus sp. rT4P-3 TaxID=3242979 RepID=UPI003DA3A0D8
MTKIKICGLRRPQDIAFVNEAMPDYAGFILEVPKSRRSISLGEAQRLKEQLSHEIQAVGVFVNAPLPRIVEAVREGIVDLVQLHGGESEEEIDRLRELVSVPIIKAFPIAQPEDVTLAMQSRADYLLFDHGSGGTGIAFDWSLVKGQKERPFFLAGGLRPENISAAIARVRPFAVDLSSGVETDGIKDREKILAAAAAVRSNTI